MSTSAVIIDDNHEVARIMAVLLKKIDIDSHMTDDYEAAISEMKDKPYRLCLLDWDLLGHKARLFLQAYAKLPQNRQSPVVALMTYRSQAVEQKAIAMGVTRCLNKPFDKESFFSVVRAALEGDTDS